MEELKVHKVTVTVGRTENIGNYESLRASISLEHYSAEGLDKVEATEVRRQLNMQAMQELESTLRNMHAAYRS